MALNKAMLIGNVGKKPEVKTFENGNKVVTFTLATTDRYKDRDGNVCEKTEWHNITVFGKVCEFVEKFVDKGSQVFVEGKIRTRSWEMQNGEKRYSTEIMATALELLGKREGKRDDAENESVNDDLPF